MRNRHDNQDQPGRREENPDIRDRLRQAGRRPEIPADDFRVIKAAARVEWEETVRSTKRPTRLPILTPLAAAALVVVALAITWFWQEANVGSTPQQVASVEVLKGDVWLEEPLEMNGESLLAVGGSIAAGVELVTGRAADAPAGVIAVRLDDGQSLRLDSGSRARLLSESRIELLEGAVYIDSGDSTPRASGVEIVTPFGRVVDIGTQFEVRLGDSEERLRVRVRSGTISLLREEETHTAGIGEELSMRADGSVQLTEFEPGEAGWDWVLTAAPALDIEGQPLSVFLAWVMDETGWKVSYEDDVLAGAASTIELHGTIEGLRPDEAVAAVLPGSGLAHRVEAGVLHIERLPPGSDGM